MIDLSVAPIFDDSVSAIAKNYHRILFIPGNAVQARELTQIQSLLQDQIKKQGDALFQNGTVIQPGNVFYDNTVISVQLAPSYQNVPVASLGQSLVGQTIQGTSGVQGKVLLYAPATQTDPDILFVKYVASNGSVSAWSPSEVLSSTSGQNVQISSLTTAVGVGAIASINTGIYYVNGFFVGVDYQTVVLSKYTTTPSCIVGLEVNEAIITAAQDPTLYDNANGSSNVAAPGASRYQLSLTLTTKNSDFSTPSGQAVITFVPLLTVLNGVIQYQLQDTQYAAIDKMLAKRTYDEAGDFVVDQFTFSTRDYRTNRRGQWTITTPYLIGDYVTNNGLTYEALNTGYSGSTAPTQPYGVASDGVINWLQVRAAKYNDGVNTVSSNVLQDHVYAEGQFVIQASPGRAYVQGFEVAVQGTQTIVANKARDTAQLTNTHIYVPIGNYIEVTNVTGIIDTATMTSINFVDSGSVVRGTAYATTMEYVSGTPGTSTAVYKLFIINIRMNSGYDLVDDIATITSNPSGFSCNVVQQYIPLTGVVETTSASPNVTGKGTTFTQQLKNGDQIQIGGVTYIVQSITNDTSLVLTTNASATLVDAAYFSVDIVGNTLGGYIQKLPNGYINSIRSANNTIDTTYVVEKYNSFTAASTSYTYTLTTPGETFTGTTGHIIATSTGTIVNATYSLDVTATQLTISGLTATTSYNIIAQVNRSGSAAREKTKTLAFRTVVINSGNVSDDYGNVLSTAYNFTSQVIPLFSADVQNIVKITMSGTTAGAYNATGESDVTAWYTMQSNAKPTHYDISTITRKSNIIAPNVPLKVTYAYFQHSAGDYFSVDSYSSIPFNQIPTEVHHGVIYDLRDCLDFRSRMADVGGTFTGTGANVSTPLNSTDIITTSYSYYLPRNDVLALSPSGTFEYIKGPSTLANVLPVITDNALQLASFGLYPYTLDSSYILVFPTPHPVYKMKDIASIDSRLSNVEQTLALNQLESNTASLTLVDSTGNQLFTNGFVADPFVDLSVSDVTNTDYKCVISFQTQTLLPNANIDSVNLVEPAGTTNTTRASNNYEVTGDWISLPYTEVPMVSQLLGSRAINVNPFAAFKWQGTVKLTPNTDSWVDTDNITLTVSK